jgi:hypothetical protein
VLAGTVFERHAICWSLFRRRRSAIAAGVVDFVLAPDEIATRLVRLAQHSLALKAREDGEAPRKRSLR